jgi:hypothetical protein
MTTATYRLVVQYLNQLSYRTIFVPCVQYIFSYRNFRQGISFQEQQSRSNKVVNATLRPLYRRERKTVPVLQEGGWAPQSVWTGVKNIVLTGIGSPDRPARNESLYRLRCPSPCSIGTLHYYNYIVMLLIVVTAPRLTLGVCLLAMNYSYHKVC